MAFCFKKSVEKHFLLSYNIVIAIEVGPEMKKMRVVQMSSNEGISYLVEHKVLGLFWYRDGYECCAGQHSLSRDVGYKTYKEAAGYLKCRFPKGELIKLKVEVNYHSGNGGCY